MDKKLEKKSFSVEFTVVFEKYIFSLLKMFFREKFFVLVDNMQKKKLGLKFFKKPNMH